VVAALCAPLSKSTRAVILDGVVKSEVVLGPAIAVDAERGWSESWAVRAPDAACAKAIHRSVRRLPCIALAAQHQAGETMVSDVATGRPINFDFTTRHLSAVLRFASYKRRPSGAAPTVTCTWEARGQLHTARESVPCVFAHSLEASFASYGMHKQRRLQRKMRRSSIPRSSNLPVAQRHHMGSRAGPAAGRKPAKELAERRGRPGSACANSRVTRRRCCSPGLTTG
jgi:hypothetical protein